MPHQADQTCQTEAAHYALLRRLGPAIRHHLVGEFQPIGMIASMLDRRLQSDAPNLGHLRDNSASLGQLARSAASTCIDLMAWLVPKNGAVTPLNSGVVDCLNLLITELRFRGFVIVNEIVSSPMNINQGALRSVLPAALLALSDQQPGPADFVLTASCVVGGVALSVHRRSAERRADNPPAVNYRPLTWHDVATLAQAESVGFVQTGDAVQLTFQAAMSGAGLEG